jgi:O-antigen/teichoic acid export membrane protein
MQFILLADINFRSVCDANNKSWQFSITDFFSKLLFLILLYLGSINKQNNLNYYVYTGLFVYIIFILLDQFIHRKSVFFSSVNFSFLKEIFPALIHLSISGIIFSSYITTDRLFIKYTSSDYALNSYSLGYKLFETYAVASGILMPILASSVKKNIDLQRLYFLDKLKHSFLKKIKIKYLSIAESLMLSLSLGLGLSLSSFVLSPFILKFLDPQNIFIESIDYIKILSIALIFLPSISLLAFLIIFLNKEQYELYTGIIMMAVTLSLYWILITNYGGYGAAWATTVATIFDLFILKIYFLYKSIKNYD